AEAAQVVEPIAEAWPDDDVAQARLGKLLLMAGDFVRAEMALSRARELAPNRIETHYLFGLMMLKKGEVIEAATSSRTQAAPYYEQAIAATREALRLKPDYGLAHTTIGLAQWQLGRRKEAVTSLRQAVHCNPEFPDLHWDLAIMLADEGARDEA